MAKLEQMFPVCRQWLHLTHDGHFSCALINWLVYLNLISHSAQISSYSLSAGLNGKDMIMVCPVLCVPPISSISPLLYSSSSLSLYLSFPLFWSPPALYRSIIVYFIYHMRHTDWISFLHCLYLPFIIQLLLILNSKGFRCWLVATVTLHVPTFSANSLLCITARITLPQLLN